MASSTLLIGDRVVLSCLGGGAEAEYALFEPGDIELRASEPGRVREHGYLTTAAQALEHLEQTGVTTELARRCANAMQPTLAEAYARGPAVRNVAQYLRAVDLLRSDVYDAGEGVYRGHFISLVELCQDAGMKGAQFLLQVCHLALILEDCPPDTSVFLATDVLMKGARPGARSFHRVPMPTGEALLEALAALAQTNPKHTPRDELGRPQVLEWIRERADAAPDDEARKTYVELERAATVRERPLKGPLADPDLWQFELQLDARAIEGMHERLDEIERTRGREPGTTYLRARLALLSQIEPARFVAERVSALALSMTNFHELELLAAEAWLAAEEPRRALPYARDLVEAPHIDEGLRMRASAVLGRVSPGGPQKLKTYADNLKAPLPSRPPPGRPSAPPTTTTGRPPRTPTKPGLAAVSGPNAETSPPPPAPDAPAPSVHPEPLPPPPSVRPPVETSPPPPSVRPPVETSPPPPSARPPALPKPTAPPQRAEPISSLPPALRSPDVSGPPAAPARAGQPSTLPPPPDAPSPSAAFTMDLPPPGASLSAPPPPAPSAAPARARSAAPPPRKPTPAPMRRRMSGAFIETRSPGALFADPRAEPDDDPPPPPRQRPSGAHPAARRSAPPPTISQHPTPAEHELPPQPVAMPSRPPPVRTSSSSGLARGTPMRPPPRDSEPALEVNADGPEVSARSQSFLQGAQQPQFQSERPPPLLPKAPLFPRVAGDEIVEHLSLPAGLGSDLPRAIDVLPKSVLEARIQFTQLARELGLDYRLKRGVELRTDVKGIETIQSALLELFPDHEVRTRDEADEVRKHGALLSEILARRLEAEWIDISANDVGYWAMIVPPDTRVWPFGRVARFISMGHKERDLVSYFLELQTRARGR